MSNKSFGLVIFCFVLSFIYLLVCREGISKSVAHHHRMQAVDKIAELDDVIASYDSDCVRPAGSNTRSFLIECLAGPLVGSDPRQVHR